MTKNYINRVNFRLLYVSLMLVGIVFCGKINAQVLITQDFTGQVATGWTATDVSSSGTNWVFDNPDSLNLTGGTANPGFDSSFAIFDSDYFCNSDEDGTLESPTFDGSLAGTYMLDFDNSFRVFSGNENAVIEVWNGTTWVTAYTMLGSDGSNGYPAPNHKTIDITSFTGGSSVAKIRFHFENGNCDWFWAVDNIKVTHLSCTPPAATFAITPDCANNQFAVNVNISSLGSATSLAIMDGSTLLTTATATGNYSLTPFVNASSHIITLVHNVDTLCNLAATETYVCPPANDLCSGAISLTSTVACTPTTGTTVGATSSGESSTCENEGNHGDIWYSFQATHTDHYINVGNISVTNSDQDDSYYGLSAYSGDCGTLNELNCASGEFYEGNQSPANLHLTGLNVGETYYLRVWKDIIFDVNSNDIPGDLIFDICVTDPPNPPVNDNCANAINVPVTNGFGDQAILATLLGATTENGMTTPSCSFGDQSNDVWFTVTVPASGNVVVQTSAASDTGATDLVMEAYTGTCGALTLLGCDDDGNPDPFPSAAHSRLSFTGLTPGTVLHMRVLPYSDEQYKQFAITAWDSTSLPAVTTAGACVAAPSVTIDEASGNLYRWVPLLDASGHIIAELYADGNVLGSVVASTYINTAAVRQSNGVYYLDRNATITPANQPGSDVMVRIYILNQELTALQTADNTVTSIADLNFSENEDPCLSAVNGATNEYSQSDNAAYGSTGAYVQFSTSTFSSIFLRGGSTPLPIFISNISAKNAGTFNEVLWITAYETAGNYFELERSADGKSFAYLDKITGKGKPSDYVYYDKKPLNGINYYRIKMISENGNSTYSKVVEAITEQGSNATIEAFPNPANSNVTLKVYGSGNGNVTLTDIAGKTIYQAKMDGSEMNINLSTLVNGFYLIHYSDGTLNKVIKLNKQ